MKFIISIFIFATLSVGLGKAKSSSLLCGDYSSSRTISLVNPSTPPNECTYEISAYSKKVCQIRIDFSMSLAQPTFPSAKNGLTVPECLDDYLQIGNLKLCGAENSQHIYVPINKTAGIQSVDIIVKSTQRKGFSKLPPLSWDIEVTQLECPAGIDLRSFTPEKRSTVKDGYLLAPAGCDQYYPDGQGIIQSFNYNNGEGIYPYNMNYVMCFRRTTATVGMLINVEDFNLGQETNGTTIFSQTDTHCYPQLPSEGRIEDYLLIPQAQVIENEVRANYFCGNSINGLSVLSTNPGPLSMVFNSGSKFEKGTKTQGFSLNYEIVSE